MHVFRVVYSANNIHDNFKLIKFVRKAVILCSYAKANKRFCKILWIPLYYLKLHVYIFCWWKVQVFLDVGEIREIRYRNKIGIPCKWGDYHYMYFKISIIKYRTWLIFTKRDSWLYLLWTLACLASIFLQGNN